MKGWGILFWSTAILLVSTVHACSVTIREISIARIAKTRISVGLEGDDIINCIGKVLEHPDRIELAIVNGRTSIKPGVYRMNRGPVDAIIVEPAVDRLLKISVILSSRPSYVLTNADNYVNIYLTIDATQRFQDWTSAEGGYITSAQGKYHFNDTLCIAWEYTFPADSILCRFKLDGPKELVFDTLVHFGEWSEWKAVAADSFKHAAYPVEGKYKVTVQFGNNRGVLEEKKIKFTIKP